MNINSPYLNWIQDVLPLITYCWNSKRMIQLDHIKLTDWSETFLELSCLSQMKRTSKFLGKMDTVVPDPNAVDTPASFSFSKTNTFSIAFPLHQLPGARLDNCRFSIFVLPLPVEENQCSVLEWDLLLELCSVCRCYKEAAQMKKNSKPEMDKKLFISYSLL